MPHKLDRRPRISVLVVNHNRLELLRCCLESLDRQTLSPFEIIVADNASTDGSRQYLNSLSSPNLRVLELEQNLGFAAANNQAFEVASGDFIALLNNDAAAHPAWLESLVHPLLENSNCGMSASKIMLDERRIDKVGHLIFWDGQNRGRGTGEVDHGQYDQDQEVLFPDGCAALYRREAWIAAGGMDETFFAYADDADLGLRIRWLGWSCLYVAGARVEHRHSATTSPYSRKKIYWVERNRCWLAVKNFPLILLPALPLFTLYRWFWNLIAALLKRGAAGRFREQDGFGSALVTIVQANLAALSGLKTAWRQRRHLRRVRKLSDGEFLSLLWRHRIRARELAFQDPEPAGVEWLKPSG